MHAAQVLRNHRWRPAVLADGRTAGSESDAPGAASAPRQGSKYPAVVIPVVTQHYRNAICSTRVLLAANDWSFWFASVRSSRSPSVVFQSADAGRSFVSGSELSTRICVLTDNNGAEGRSHKKASVTGENALAVAAIRARPCCADQFGFLPRSDGSKRSESCS
jgi:hypothetical protein